MTQVNFGDFPVIIDDTLPPNTIYMMPTEVHDLIKQAKRGELDWGYVIEEVTQAARDGRIGIIKDIS